MSLSLALVATQGHELGSSHQLMSTHPIHDGAFGGGAARRPPAVARGRAGGASVETGDEANKKQVTRYCRDQARCTYVFINIYTPHRIGRLLSSQSYTYALRITTTVVVALSISLAYTVSPLMSSGLQQPWAPARSPAKP